MNRRDDQGLEAHESSGTGGVSNAVRTVVGILFAETALLAGVAVWLLVELLVDRPDSYATAIAMLVLVLIAVAWLAATAVAAARLQSWSRASAIVWQILQISVAVGAFQGLFAQPAVGWALLVPALVVIGLLLWAPVRERFTPEEHREA